MDEKKLGRLLRAGKKPMMSRGRGCPDETQLAGYVEGRLPTPEKSLLENHLSECDYCLGQVAALLRLEGAPMTENVSPALLARARDLVQAPVAPSVWPVLRWGAIAAATACLAIVATVWMHRQESEMLPPAAPPAQAPAVSTPAPPAVPPPATTRREVRAANPPGPQLTLLAPREGSVLAREKAEIRWTSVRSSLYYDVRVLTADGDLVWEGRTEGNQTQIPESIRLLPGAKYFVSVHAYLPEGKTVASPVVGFSAQSHD